MDIWFIFSIVSTLLVGTIAFINKIFAERKYDPKFSAIILGFIMFFISFIYILLNESYTSITIIQFFLSLIWGFQMYSYALIMMIALKFLPTSTYFISVRLGSSFILFSIGIIFFNDVITNLEFFGFILGAVAISLLFEKENKKNTNYKKGIPILILGIISLTVGHTITKYISLDQTSSPFLLSLSCFFFFIFSILFGFKNIKPNLINLKPIFLINLLQGSLYLIYFSFILFYVYRLGDLGISYKIQSYSPFIPIILSFMIYKEKITKKQFIAIILSLISFWFFT